LPCLPIRATLVDECLDAINGIVVVNALRLSEILLRLLILAQEAVGRPAHLECLGRVRIEFERLVAVADGCVWLLHLEEAVGPLGIGQCRRRQLQDAREPLDGTGVVAVR